MAFTFGEFELDDLCFELRRRGEPLELRSKIFDVLLHLVRHRDRVVSKHELLEVVWGKQYASESTVSTCIMLLRKTLGDQSGHQRIIRTVRRRGYQFVAPVEETQRSEVAPQAHGTLPTPLVGRQRELSQLDSALESSLAGQGRLVLVAGEPGIGKSRTLDEFTRRVKGRAVVQTARCFESEGAPAYWPWLQILEGLLSHRDAKELQELLGESARELSPLLRDFIAVSGSEAAPAEIPNRARLFRAVAQLLKRLAGEMPLVLGIDDLHRADLASLLLLRFLANELSSQPILVVASYRDVEVSREWEREVTFGELVRAEVTLGVQLGGLSKQESGELAEIASGRTLNPDLVDAIYDQTSGNPFFVGQVAQALETNELTEGLPLPASVRQAVRQQLDGLPKRVQDLLVIASVAGREFSSTLLADAADYDGKELLEDLDAAVAARVIFAVPNATGRFSFSHLLVRDALYEDLNTVQRLSLHARIAGALEKIHGWAPGPHVVQLAHHYFEAAALGDTERAVHYARSAAEWSTARLAYEAAVFHYQRALQLLETRGEAAAQERCELLLRLGEAQTRASDRGAGEESFRSAVDLARASGDAERLARAALGYAPGFFAMEVGGADAYLMSLLEESLRSLPETDSPLRAQLLARIAMALNWDDPGPRRRGFARDAVEMAERLGEPATLAFAMTAREIATWNPEHPDRRADFARQAIELAHRTGDHENELVYRLIRISSLWELGRFDQAQQEIEAFRETAGQLSQPHSLWYLDLFAAGQALMRGDWSEAERLAESFAEQGRLVGDVNVEHCYFGHTATRLLEQARFEEGLEVVQRMVAKFPRLTVWQCIHAYVLRLRGHTEQAKAELSRLAADDFAAVPDDATSLCTLTFLGAASALLLDRQHGRQLYERLEPFESQYAVMGYGVLVSRPVSETLGWLALVNGKLDAAERHFETTLERSRGVSPLWMIHARRGLAFVAAGRGQASRAREIAEAALPAARDLNLVPVARGFERFLQQLGA